MSFKLVVQKDVVPRVVSAPVRATARSISNNINRTNVHPLTNRPFVTLEVACGLANRLRALMAYYLIFVMARGWELHVLWKPSPFCPGTFESLFRSLPLVRFYREPAGLFERLRDSSQSRGHFAKQHYRLDQILKRHGFPPLSPHQEKDLHSRLLVLPGIAGRIAKFADHTAIPLRVGLHVRRTDYNRQFVAKFGKKFRDDREWFRLIDNLPNDTLFFLATDNAATQQQFMERFGKRWVGPRRKLVVFAPIAFNGKVRKTSLERAVIDLWLLSMCRRIVGTEPSSFTHLARLIQTDIRS